LKRQLREERKTTKQGIDEITTLKEKLRTLQQSDMLVEITNLKDELYRN
jgi:hypothetical protein